MINDSLASYTPCKAPEKGTCACLTPGVEEDLKPWAERGGVMSDDFTAAKEMGYAVHYQIVNHTLFRQHKCNFPSRYINIKGENGWQPFTRYQNKKNIAGTGSVSEILAVAREIYNPNLIRPIVIFIITGCGFIQ